MFTFPSRREFLTRSALALGAWRASGPPAVGQAAETGPFHLGLNLSELFDWSTDIVFVDRFKNARLWISQAENKPWGNGGPLKADEHGKLLSLAPGQYAEAMVWVLGPKTLFPTGNFTCLYDGEGDVDMAFDATVVSRSPGRLKVQVKLNEGQASVRVKRTNPGNPVRNIRVILPGFENAYQDRPFHPKFLEEWKGFDVIRFTDWQHTNGSQIVEWADRNVNNSHTQAMTAIEGLPTKNSGAALEYMIELSNTLDASPWFSMPHQASDDFVKQFATMVKDKLKPSLKVYVEYSNECWNTIFPQTAYCQKRGVKLNLSKDRYEAGLRFYSQRAVEMFKIWQGAFGQKSRLARVLAAQTDNLAGGLVMADWREAFKSADVLAIAPYFGASRGTVESAAKTALLTPDALIKALEQDVADVKKQVAKYAEAAKQRGLQLAAYEAGQHLAAVGPAQENQKLTDLFIAANRHPGMKGLYQAYLRDWRQVGGGLLCHFASMNNPGKYGSWGLLEQFGQDPQTAPKYMAIRELLDRH